MDNRGNFRWNFTAAVIDAAGWGVGMGLVSATTILPLFVRQLTPSPVATGLIQAAMLFGWLVPGILVSATTILPLFVRQLTPSPVATGLIQAVMLFGWLVPGILVSGWVERLPRVKGPVLGIAILERLMLLLMVFFCLWLGPRDRPAL